MLSIEFEYTDQSLARLSAGLAFSSGSSTVRKSAVLDLDGEVMSSDALRSFFGSVLSTFIKGY